MRYQKASKCFYFIVLLFLSNSGFTQDLKQEKMEQLIIDVQEEINNSKNKIK